MTSRGGVGLVAVLVALGCQATQGAGAAQTPPAVQTPPAAPARYATTPPHPAAFEDPERPNKIAALIPRLSERVDVFFAAEKPPSIAVVFICDGKPALVRTLGVAERRTKAPATPATVYRIGSITKTFTASLIVALRDLGRLRLDDPAQLYLPELAGLTYPFPDSSRITLRHLLTHTSGLPRLGDFDYTRTSQAVTEAEILSAVSRARLDSAPGVAFVYSNFGMSLAGLIAARRAPEGTLRGALDAHLLAPLGMTRTSFDPSTLTGAPLATGYVTKTKDDPAAPWLLGASEGAGGLWSSAEDMGRWVAFQLQAWPPRPAPDSGPVVRASLREMHTPAHFIGLEAHRGPMHTEASTTSLGLAWHIKQTCEFEQLVEHSGAIDGFRAHVAFAPDRGFGFVVLANSLDTPVDRLMDGLLADAAPRLEPRHPQPAPDVLEAFKQLTDPAAACSKSNYEALFTKEFREQVAYSNYAPICAQLRALHGNCRYGGVRHLDGPRAGDFTLICDRGAVAANATVGDEGGRTRFGGLVVHSTGFAVKPEVARAADEVLRLYEKWDDTRSQNLFADAAARESIRHGFEGARAVFGACRLAVDSATAKVGDGGNGAVFPIRCERGDPPDLALEIDDQGRIKQVPLPPAPAAALPRRCR